MMLIPGVFRVQKEGGRKYLIMLFMEEVGLGFIYSLNNYLSSYRVQCAGDIVVSTEDMVLLCRASRQVMR